MLLPDAVKLACRFASKSKVPSGAAPNPLASVRLLSAVGDFPPRLHATDGVVGVLCSVDQPVPNLLLPASELAKAVQAKAQILRIENVGLNHAEIYLSRADGDATYSFEGLPLSEFPGFPVPPESFRPVDIDSVLQVLHSAGKEPHKPRYHVVRLRDDRVEAFDGYRLARAELSNGWAGLLPAHLFDHWPKKQETQYVFTEHHAFFRVGDQLRFSPVLHDKGYPNLEELIPEKYVGPWCVVSRASLLSAVQRAGKLSPTSAVQLCFGVDKLVVKAWAEPGKECKLVLEIRPDRLDNRPCFDLLMSAKLLEESLRVMETPRVKLCYGDANQPVRLESGGFTECIWPMRSSQPGV
jgi:DNA polymerase III sliding clamp (beta) subunit (PCNA family)